MAAEQPPLAAETLAGVVRRTHFWEDRAVRCGALLGLTLYEPAARDSPRDL